MRHSHRHSLRGVVVPLLALALAATACSSESDPQASEEIAATAEPAGDEAPSGQPSSAATEDAGAALDELIEAAEAEGEVTIYHTGGIEIFEAFEKAFETEYPSIDLEAVRMTSAEIESRVETELSTGADGADLVWTPSEGWLMAQADAGNLVPPTKSPELLGEGAYDADLYVAEAGYFNLTAPVLTMAWNTDLVPDGLTGYEDLLDPSLKGQIATVDAEFGAPIVDFYLWLSEKFGDDYIEQLAAQEPTIYPGAQPITQALAAGEIAATVYSSTNIMVPLMEDGAPIDFLIADEGAWGARSYGAIPTSAQNPNAAELLANYIVTREAQEILAASAASVLPEIDTAVTTMDQIRIMDLENTTPEKVAAYQQRFDQLFR